MLEHIKDCVELSAGELHRKYEKEYNSWKNMKQRCRPSEGEYTLHPSFSDFSDFLSMMGPMPGQGYTLDRIDFTDNEYAPGKVRWADKTTQTENRSSTVFLNINDSLRSIKGWAETTGQKYSNPNSG